MQLKQKGFTLLEGLISILLLSIGLIGMAFFQNNMLKQTTHTQFRTQAGNLLRSAIAEMEVNSSSVKCYTTADSCGNAWRAKVAALSGEDNASLGVAHNLKVTVAADGVVTIEIYWSLNSDLDVNKKPVWHSVRGRYAPIKPG